MRVRGLRPLQLGGVSLSAVVLISVVGLHSLHADVAWAGSKAETRYGGAGKANVSRAKAKHAKTSRAPVGHVNRLGSPGHRNACGLYAAQSSLSALGIHARIADLRLSLGRRYPEEGHPTGEGYSLADLQVLFAEFGLHTQGFRVSLKALTELPTPAILRLRGVDTGHFVALHDIDSQQRALLYDPLMGSVRIPAQSLASRWLDPQGFGVALLIDRAAPQ